MFWVLPGMQTYQKVTEPTRKERDREEEKKQEEYLESQANRLREDWDTNGGEETTSWKEEEEERKQAEYKTNEEGHETRERTIQWKQEEKERKQTEYKTNEEEIWKQENAQGGYKVYNRIIIGQ